ncbi:unnamed protein product [Phaedon cochleariae]|uniref:RRM domain-containing protein n=2 Tax=Endopterygota TaxID=33392 RepID=A0A9P0DLC3_PHACE|nr:unnamed protein product [Phaedon cochleariae]
MNSKQAKILLLVIVIVFLYKIFRYYQLSNDEMFIEDVKIIHKVKVSVHYEALCPDSKFFITYHLLPTFEDLEDFLILDLVPYGKAQTMESNGKITFLCQHDALECFANKIHACVIDAVKNPLIQLKYIACMISDNMVPEEVGERCGKELNIDFLPIAECAKDIKGSQLLKQHGERTNSLSPSKLGSRKCVFGANAKAAKGATFPGLETEEKISYAAQTQPMQSLAGSNVRGQSLQVVCTRKSCCSVQTNDTNMNVGWWFTGCVFRRVYVYDITKIRDTVLGLYVVEISVNSAAKGNQNTLFYTTPTSSGNGTESILKGKNYISKMQDDLSEKAIAAVSVSGANNGDDLSATVGVGANSVGSPLDKNAVAVKDCDSAANDLADKLNEVARNSKSAPCLPPLFHPSEPSTPAGALWSTAIEDGYVPSFANVNGGASAAGMGFQNFPSPTQQQLFGNNPNQNHVNQNRRAITASHNFPHNMARQQSLSNHLYKGYGSWANPPGQNWSPGNSSGWNRGRSVPNLTPLQQMGVGLSSGVGRKPSPTFNQQQVISPVKFRRSTSYPGKGPFPQPPTFEITNMDEARELMSYQDRCGVVNANGSSPLENMRGLEHYLNDIMSPQSNTTDMKGFINTNVFPSLQLHGKSPYFPGLDEQPGGPVLLEEPAHLSDSALGAQPLGSPSRSSPHSQGSEGGERFSRKVFVGGLPPDIDEDEITVSFRRFGPLVVDWPHKAESKSYFPPKGILHFFQDENSVQSLIDACITDEDKLYLCVSSPTIKDKPVQIRPWRLSDADFVLDASMPLDPRKTVFVGGVPRPLKAVELAMIMDRLYGGVCYAGIDTDPELKYPKGAGRVAFSNQQSYIAAISARFVQLQHGDIDKRVEVKPYVLDDQMCDECQGQRCGGKFAPFFCANVTCLQYYCEHCWATIHSRPGREFHKPLVKEGADRPRAVPFRWC